MKSITIVIDQVEDQNSAEYDLECAATVNGIHYHNALSSVLRVLVNYDKNKTLTPDARAVLDGIRSKTAKHFKGLLS